MSNEEGDCNNWITIKILRKAGALHMLISAQLVCTQWREICTDPSTWTTIRVVDWLSYMTPQFDGEYRINVENTIRRAVDQSCGTLFDLDLDELMYENLIPYAANRCTKIKRIRVSPTMWYADEDDVLETVPPKLPLLEDLEFYGRLSLEAIETLGRYCPRLSSLKIRIYRDEQAKAIGRNMPQLRHISISGENFVTAIGMEAILDGCVHLESLDLDIRHPLNSRIKATFQMRKKMFPPTRTRQVTIRVGMITVFPWISHDHEKFKHVKDVIRRVVDKTCGELVDVDLDIFMSATDILPYVVERCTQIRRLRGYLSFNCSEKALRAAAEKLPLLENLELVYFLRKTIGRCCPKLTSLEIPIEDDEGAKTIARSFPQLRYLKSLNVDQLVNVGVEGFFFFG